MPAVAAVAAVGWSAASATMIFAAVAQVGLALSVVGAVTGNSTLMKIGGVMGLVGGVGGLVSGLGNATTSGLVEAGVEGSVEGGGAFVDGAYNEYASTIAQAPAADAISGAAGAAPINMSPNPMGYEPSSIVDRTGGNLLNAVEDGTASMDAAINAPSVNAPSGPGLIDAPMAPGAPTVQGFQSPTNPLGAVQPQSGGWLSDIMSKDNRSLLVEGAKLVGGGLQGMEKTRLAEEALKQRLGESEYYKLLKEREAANANAQPTLAGRLAYQKNPNLFTQPTQKLAQFNGLINARA